MRLAYAVVERIHGEPLLSGEPIVVDVQNLVVSLRGTVSSSHARLIAADIARTTPGAADLCNRLRLARTADVTHALCGMWPDPFDEVVARWNDPQPVGPTACRTGPGNRGLLKAAAAAAAAVTAVLWLILVPRFGSVGLILVVPCVGVTMVLALIASPPGQRTAKANRRTTP
jgi:hypothetical protein